MSECTHTPHSLVEGGASQMPIRFHRIINPSTVPYSCTHAHIPIKDAAGWQHASSGSSHAVCTLQDGDEAPHSSCLAAGHLVAQPSPYGAQSAHCGSSPPMRQSPKGTLLCKRTPCCASARTAVFLVAHLQQIAGGPVCTLQASIFARGSCRRLPAP